MSVFLSCEHGGQLVPPALSGRSDLALPSTSTDPARQISLDLSRWLDAPLIRNDFSSALIDVRRSLHHRGLFGPTTRTWNPHDRQLLVDSVYLPYRDRIRQTIADMLARNGFVVHLSVQSFALRSKTGKLRRADVGLLYDPSRLDEVDFCMDWIDELYDEAPMLRVRRNYPRRGTNDSLTKAMRSEFDDQHYLGIELLLGRAWSERNVGLRTEAIQGIAWALKSLVNDSIAAAA